MNEKNLSTTDIANAYSEHNEEVSAGGGAAIARDSANAGLLLPDQAADFRKQWERIQAGFVDEPRGAVQEADSLVASAIKRLAEVFSEEKGKLESQWDRGGEVSTEDLRQALRRYRSFFDRLLSV